MPKNTDSDLRFPPLKMHNVVCSHLIQATNLDVVVINEPFMIIECIYIIIHMNIRDTHKIIQFSQKRCKNLFEIIS